MAEPQGIAEVRAALSSDVDGLLDALDAVVNEDRWLGTERGYDRARYRERFLASIGDASQAVFVAVAADEVVGSCGVHPHPEYGHVLGMSLVQAWRGRGLGATLLETALAWSRERGLAQLSLLVFEHNERARRLYERYGFMQRERFERDVTRTTGEVYDVILMTASLER